MLHRHYSLNFVLTQLIKNINSLLVGAYKEESEQKAWDMYLTHYPHMNKENFISFEEWYNRPLDSPDDDNEKSSEEILKDVRLILQGGG